MGRRAVTLFRPALDVDHRAAVDETKGFNRIGPVVQNKRDARQAVEFGLPGSVVEYRRRMEVNDLPVRRRAEPP